MTPAAELLSTAFPLALLVALIYVAAAIGGIAGDRLFLLALAVFTAILGVIAALTIAT